MTTPRGEPLRLLIVEDRASDIDLLLHEVRKAGFAPTYQVVDTEAAFEAALDPSLDVILSDFYMPAFDAPRAIALLRARDLDVPLIVVSGSIGEEQAVEALRLGATDYLLKDRLGRLGEAIRRAIERRRLEQEKHAAERIFREFAEQTSAIVWILDASGRRMRYVNPAYERVWGQSAESLYADMRTFLRPIHPDDRARVEAELATVAARDPAESVEFRLLGQRGGVRWIRSRSFRIRDSDGTVTAIAGFSEEVTAQKHLETQLRQAQKTEALGRLAGGIAHDFNNILTALQGYADMLADAAGPDAAMRDYVEEIQGAAARATALTRQLLAFSRQQIIEPRVLDLFEMAEGLRPMLARLIPQHIQLTLRASAPHVHVRMDPGQVEQLIMNLALNARDAMPHGGSLLIDVGLADRVPRGAQPPVANGEGPHAVLTVSDTGVGIEPAVRARLFEPFFTTKAAGDGTGLGLANVFSILEGCGGHATVDSEPGHGATFRLYLPAAAVEAAPAPAPAPAGAPLGGTETVLVVEDGDSVRGLVQRLLTRHGYTVLAAASPQEALNAAQAHHGPIDLLISDLVLPQAPGSAVARQIASRYPDVRILFMSGYANDALAQQDVRAGVPFLSKPFKLDDLLRKVREVLNGPPPPRP